MFKVIIHKLTKLALKLDWAWQAFCIKLCQLKQIISDETLWASFHAEQLGECLHFIALASSFSRSKNRSTFNRRALQPDQVEELFNLIRLETSHWPSPCMLIKYRKSWAAWHWSRELKGKALWWMAVNDCSGCCVSRLRRSWHAWKCIRLRCLKVVSFQQTCSWSQSSGLLEAYESDLLDCDCRLLGWTWDLFLAGNKLLTSLFQAKTGELNQYSLRDSLLFPSCLAKSADL